MKEFNKHGWNDLKEVKLPGHEFFRVEIGMTAQSDGPMVGYLRRRYIGVSAEDGELALNVDGRFEALRLLNFSRIGDFEVDKLEIKVRLWEEQE